MCLFHTFVLLCVNCIAVTISTRSLSMVCYSICWQTKWAHFMPLLSWLHFQSISHNKWLSYMQHLISRYYPVLNSCKHAVTNNTLQLVNISWTAWYTISLEVFLFEKFLLSKLHKVQSCIHSNYNYSDHNKCSYMDLYTCTLFLALIQGTVYKFNQCN